MKTTDRKLAENAVIAEAIKILESRVEYRTDKPVLDSPQSAKDLVRLKLLDKERELFGVLFLDNRHRLIDFKILFYGTIDGASVYPREVVKESLDLNCAAVVFAHNHPSGNSEPSNADIRITKRLKDALELVDVRVLDHLIVGETITSFAEKGIL